MDVKYINPFLDGLKQVLQNFGIETTQKLSISKKDNMNVDLDITSVIGIIGDLRGNIAYSLSNETAKNIVSGMMMGMPVSEIDSMGRSAIGELSNMITGTASSIFASNSVSIDITPPSIIFGEEIYFVISSVQAITVKVETSAGLIEVNIGLEV